MKPFTLFLILFTPGATLEVAGTLAFLLLRRRRALPAAFAGAALVGLAAILDRDFTLLAGQGLLACVLWREARTP